VTVIPGQRVVLTLLQRHARRIGHFLDHLDLLGEREDFVAEAYLLADAVLASLRRHPVPMLARRTMPKRRSLSERLALFQD